MTTATFAMTLGLTLLATALIVPARTPPAGERPQVLATEIATEITPVVADQVQDGVADAEDGGYAAYVIELDTPGGLGSAMRSIVQATLTSEVPVIVYVTPEGARAASAGAIITLASHVAVMAPGTSIGAATPVGLQGDDLSEKVVNDAAAFAESLAQTRGRNVETAEAMVREGVSLTVEEAVEQDIVDFQATTLDQALQRADGTSVKVADDRTVTVATAGAAVDRYDISLFRQVQQFLANPNLAFVLLALGTLGLLYELATPGVGIAGSVGVVSLLLALFSLAILPVNVVGLLLLAVSAALFVGELFAPGIAGFAFGGAVTLVLAALFLFEDAEGVQVDPAVAVPTAVVVGVLAIVAGRLVVRSHRRPTTRSGTGQLIGRVVTVDELDESRTTRGRTHMDGSWWKLRSADAPLHQGDDAEIVDVDGLTLVVRPVPPQQAATGMSPRGREG